MPVAIAGTDQVMGRDSHRIGKGHVTVVVCEAIDPALYSGIPDALAAMTAEWGKRVGDALESVSRESGLSLVAGRRSRSPVPDLRFGFRYPFPVSRKSHEPTLTGNRRPATGQPVTGDKDRRTGRPVTFSSDAHPPRRLFWSHWSGTRGFARARWDRGATPDSSRDSWFGDPVESDGGGVSSRCPRWRRGGGESRWAQHRRQTVVGVREALSHG